MSQLRSVARRPAGMGKPMGLCLHTSTYEYLWVYMYSKYQSRPLHQYGQPNYLAPALTCSERQLLSRSQG
jgi:hypothetical protein